MNDNVYSIKPPTGGNPFFWVIKGLYAVSNGLKTAADAQKLIDILIADDRAVAARQAASEAADDDAANVRFAAAVTRPDADGYVVVEIDDAYEVLPVRVSANGNMVDCGGHGRWPGGSFVVGRAASREGWPTLHPTALSALYALNRLHDACEHDYRILSHEEDQCAKCGDCQFVPDL